MKDLSAQASPSSLGPLEEFAGTPEQSIAKVRQGQLIGNIDKPTGTESNAEALGASP